MRKSLLLAAAAIATVLATSSLPAQVLKGSRSGFYVSGGGGYASNKVSIALFDIGTTNESGSGATWYAGLGMFLSPGLALGIEWNYAKTGCTPDCGSDNKITNSFYSAALSWFPSTNNDFFAKINLGYGGNAISGSTSTSENGFAGGLGVGYDWHLGSGGLIVKPFVNYMTQFSKSTYGGDFAGDGDKGSASLWQFGVGIGYKH